MLAPRTDGTVVLRAPRPGDAAVLIAGRDEVFHRWLGPGADQPAPVFCIEVDGHLVGWVDYDTDHPWLGDGEVNVGYALFAPDRGKGYARRAVELLLQHLAEDTIVEVATVLIDPANAASLAVAARTGFHPAGDIDGQQYFTRRVQVR